MRTWSTGTNGDIKTRRGAFVMVTDARAVGRTVERCLRDIQGEYFLGGSSGMPWNTESRPEALAAKAKAIASSVEGVSSVGKVETKQVENTLQITLRFRTQYSPTEQQAVIG